MSSPGEQHTPSKPALAGIRAILPLALAAFPFGLVYGVLVAQSDVPNWVGAVASPLIYAGASQIALVDLLDRDVPIALAVGTALIINLRMMMYSAALAPAISKFGRGWRIALPYAITDQLTVISLRWFEDEPDPRARRVFFASAGLFFLGVWVSGTLVGIATGAQIPDGLQIGFAIPLTFLALLMPTLKGRPEIAAALAAGVVVVMAAGLPYSLGIPIGAVVGIAAGLAVSR